jgi:hypothetical protein
MDAERINQQQQQHMAMCGIAKKGIGWDEPPGERKGKGNPVRIMATKIL